MVLEGFVVSDKTRRAVFVELATAGPSTLERLVKRLRLIRPAAERALRELVDEKLVERAEGEVRLTAEGARVAEEIRRLDFLR